MTRRDVCAVLLVLARAGARDGTGLGSDVRYIRCETCEALVGALHSRISADKKAAKKPLSEAAVHTVVEEACKADAPMGAWLRSIDLVEDGTRLTLVKQGQEGPCGSECQTLVLACEALLEEGWENELGEALYGSDGEAELRQQACHEWSSACRKPPPKLPASRPAGPPFRPLSEVERARIERQGLGAAPAAGTLSESALLSAMGVQADAAAPAENAHDQEDAYGWSTARAAEGSSAGHVAANRLADSPAFERLERAR